MLKDEIFSKILNKLEEIEITHRSKVKSWSYEDGKVLALLKKGLLVEEEI